MFLGLIRKRLQGKTKNLFKQNILIFFIPKKYCQKNQDADFRLLPSGNQLNCSA